MTPQQRQRLYFLKWRNNNLEAHRAYMRNYHRGGRYDIKKKNIKPPLIYRTGRTILFFD